MKKKQGNQKKTAAEIREDLIRKGYITPTVKPPISKAKLNAALVIATALALMPQDGPSIEEFLSVNGDTG